MKVIFFKGDNMAFDTYFAPNKKGHIKSVANYINVCEIQTFLK